MKKSKRSTLAEVMLGNDDLTTDSVARRAMATTSLSCRRQ
jgi:hypothetical protein